MREASGDYAAVDERGVHGEAFERDHTATVHASLHASSDPRWLCASVLTRSPA
jgi:hypothetical protein